jgi:serine/threonine-protein kinase
MATTPEDSGGDETLADTRPVEQRAAVTLVAGRYEVKRLLGEGGMGEVHECRDSVIARSVALKTIRRDRSRRQLEARLVREGRVQAQLEHPSIVPVYDLGQDATGLPYFTMRKLTGTPLDDVITRAAAGDSAEPFSRHRLLTAFSQICLALEFAHARGVLHRDLKPANIMLGEFGEVYVLDWGIAKLGAPDPAQGAPAIVRTEGDRHITVAGTALGTPGYMAPEQIAASTKLDARADVFALGAVLFEILTLEPLLDDPAIEARLRGQAAIWDARPSVRAPKRGVPPEFDRICSRATAADPADRYPSARALHDEIEAYLDGERDIGLRRKLAAEHLARAEATRNTDRDEALRNVNAALAIAGEDRRALELLVDLLEEPSAAEAARAEVEAEGITRHRGSQPFVVLFTIPWFTFYPLILWKRGVTNLPLAILPIVMWAAATIATRIVQGRKTGETATYPIALFMCALAGSSVVLGPLLLVPSFATAIYASHMLIQPRRLRRATTIWTALAMVVPMVFVWLGLYTPYGFPDETTLLIHGITREMNVQNLGIYLSVTDLAFVVGVAFFAMRFREWIDRARTDKTLLAWQLSKLLPPLDGKIDPPTGGGPPPHEESKPLPSIGYESTFLEATAVPEGDETTKGATLALDGARYSEGEEIAPMTRRVHDRLIGRDVAMKRSVDDSAREALFQASVEHPFIPPIYDVGTDDAGPWFTTKLVRGKRLAEIAASNLEVRGRHERLSALAKVCLTIEYAHSRGVVHAGLDSDNVVLGEFGEVYVVGWSNAKRVDADASTDVAALGTLLQAVAGAPIPETLAKICKRATSAEPENRFPSARALHDALESFLAADTDEELRRELAAERLAKAERRANRAFEKDDTGARIGALRELGRALALAPDRTAALALLARLLQNRPRHLPTEVRYDLEGQIWDVSAKSAPLTSVIYIVSFLVVFPIYSFIVGIREPAKFAAVVVAWAVAAFITWGQTKIARDTKLRGIPLPAFVVCVAIVTTSFVLGPWFMGPSIAITVTMVYTLAVQARWRHAMIACGGFAVALPSLAALFDLSDVVELRGGMLDPKLVIHGADFHPPATFLFMLVVVNLASVLAAGFYAAQYRDLLDELEADNRAKVHALSRLM